MSSYDPLLPPEMGRRRTSSLILPEDPSPEELAQFWTLSDLDRAEVIKCQGDANQRRFAVQLCTLRTYGRFLPEATPAPVAMTNYLARQLDLPLVLFGDVPIRLATETGHRFAGDAVSAGAGDCIESGIESLQRGNTSRDQDFTRFTVDIFRQIAYGTDAVDHKAVKSVVHPHQNKGFWD